MSSKSAAARGNKEALFQILSLIETGHFSHVSHQKLQYLKRYAYITSSSNGYILASKGRRAFTESSIWTLRIVTPKQWDKRWRLVLFDIPTNKNKRRDAFRLRIRELGLVLYQNSVWVYPYPLEEPILAIADFYKLKSYISFVVAEKISGEANLRKHFKL